MVKLSVCIEMFWPDLPYEERARRVKALGYSAFEFWGWKHKDLARLRAVQQETGLSVAALAVEPNGRLVERDDEHVLVAGVAESAAVAHTLRCTQLIVTTGNAIWGESFETTRRRVVRKLRLMVRAAEENGVRLVLEPLNPLVDHPGYWLPTMAQAADIVQEIASPQLRMLMDLYHQQVTEGNLLANFRTYLPLIGHVHAAGVPGRHELVGGELDYGAIFAAIDGLGYDGYVGLEFRPTLGEEEALRQALALA